MYKKIPYTREYRLRCADMEIVNLRNDVVSHKDIHLGDNDKVYNKDFLTAIAWLEIEPVAVPLERLHHVSFVNVDSNYLKLRKGLFMIFEEPIYYTPGYRVIPNYPRYAISQSGVVINIATNQIVKQEPDSHGYTSVYVRVPDRGCNAWVKHHRLMAMAWVDNDDHAANCIVNHLDGVKTNNAPSNLEWTTVAGNNAHSRRIGLNHDNTPMKVRDRYTKEVVYYNTASEMSKSLRMRNVAASSYLNKLPGYLYKRRYEIKKACDSSPWFYENTDIDSSFVGKTVYTITITERTGSVSIFNRLKAVLKKYGNVPDDGGIETRLGHLREKRPDLTIKLVRYGTVGPYAVRAADGSIQVVNTIPEVSEITGINRNTIRYNLFQKNMYIYNGYRVNVVGDSTPDDEYVPYTQHRLPVEVTFMDTGEVTVYSSARAAARELGISNKTIQYRATIGKAWKNYKFRSVRQ